MNIRVKHFTKVVINCFKIRISISIKLGVTYKNITADQPGLKLCKDTPQQLYMRAITVLQLATVRHVANRSLTYAFIATCEGI